MNDFGEGQVEALIEQAANTLVKVATPSTATLGHTRTTPEG